MEREALLLTVAAALCVPSLWLVSATLPAAHRPSTGAEPERRAWRLLIAPLFGEALVIAFLVGWALQEPDPADERLAPWVFLFAAITAAVAARALWRAVLSWRTGASARPAAGTLGLFNPRVVVSGAFREAAAPEVLRAALAHERAHARHRDPVRIWLAQLAADLQWPFLGARRRLDAWMLALEIRRDDEALAAGVAPADLAEAILIAARLQSTGAAPTAAANGAGVALRVRRLLGHEHPNPRFSSAARRPIYVLLIALLLTANWLGVAYGEVLFDLLPGVKH